MFTGIIKAIGTIEELQRHGGDLRLTVVSGDLPWAEYAIGDSIAINGVCLTAVSLTLQGFVADVSTETIEVTALKGLATGDRVNLEPALRLGDALGGHLVTGHVDCVGTVRSCREDARSIRLTIDVPTEYARYIARKGSICVDGVSLTVNAVSERAFDVNIIPHTSAVTIIGDYREGRAVNIEVDLLARYLERMMSDRRGVTEDFLREHGYA